jgi:hypothetical protein
MNTGCKGYDKIKENSHMIIPFRTFHWVRDYYRSEFTYYKVEYKDVTFHIAATGNWMEWAR